MKFESQLVFLLLDQVAIALQVLFCLGRMEKTLNERLSSLDAMKTIAFSVYSQSRILLPDVVGSILPTSMTRFGPASAMNDLLEKLRKNEDPVFYKVTSAFSCYRHIRYLCFFQIGIYFSSQRY